MLPERRALRLPHYDYTTPGAYFVTICTQNRACSLSRIVNDQVTLFPAGEVSKAVLLSLPRRFAGVELDAFVIMPNHIHAILTLVGVRFIASENSPLQNPLGNANTPAPASLDVQRQHLPPRASRGNAAADENALRTGSPIGRSRADAINRTPTVGEIVRAFKASVARQVRVAGAVEFAWQRSYYEHVLRTEDQLGRARRYIGENPLRWALDEENPRRG
jgi:REP element-mobilizing transposase RayT